MTRARALATLVASAVTGYVVGELAAHARRVTSGADSLAQDVERFGMEQAALRRVATLVARAAAPEEVFAAVTAEVGRLLGTEYASSGTSRTARRRGSARGPELRSLSLSPSVLGSRSGGGTC
ncbi:hypothetical protein [Pseudonocardia alaniniphila]|uniref:Uncharacterized protein n=1 Tax=Pseudonocardia alaniniphila TaxID=75291 RepID=A0ABS9TP21_9PSEU|nr:hypothetical protein [Pseudonocardia alaniniphila]MCH6170280.1 hypothetical protein [Pseudonocardia alaniniphila]